MSKVSVKVAKNLEKNLGSAISDVFLDKLDDLIDSYMDTYDEELASVITDKESLANPDYFYDDYKEALEDFDYVEEENDGLIIRIPSEDTFDFGGRLNFIALLVHGTAGKYLELPEAEHDQLVNSKDLDKNLRKSIRRLPPFFDSNTPKELRFYLLQTTRGGLYKTVENILGRKLVVFPFSNTSSIDLFGPSIKFFEENIYNMFEEAIDNTNKRVRGV